MSSFGDMVSKRSGENLDNMKQVLGNSGLDVTRVQVSITIDVHVVGVLGEVKVMKMGKGDHREGRM